ncbi:Zn(2)-C6 fungal-type domain-containing protein [Fusarium sp. Ph1]|nr:Zn(2)-C6 fungal-type domain-containing protein [Fusarium sp. Ph1]
MEPDTYDKPEASPQHTLRRACDPCRARKIRCNREDPCSRCITTKIECTHSDTAPREKRTRILLTPQYEKKIDRIDGQLQAVIGLLQDLKTNPPSGNPQTTHQAPTVQSCAPSPGNYTTPSTSAVIEGDSSLSAHCAFANDFVQQAAGAEPLRSSSALGMQETLEALSRVVDALKQPTVANEMAYPHARPIQRPSIGERELPPFQNALTVIRLAKAQRLAGSGWIYEFILVRQFSEICLNVYFSEEYSETDFIIVNAGLHSLFGDHSDQVPVEEKGTYLEYAHLCRENLETALANLPLQLPATTDFIVALLFGAWHAIELSKPSLSWTLCSKASELCHTLGYHRATSMQTDAPDEIHFKKFLFWSVYFIEKCLSLRLGRPSTMPDWDITISRPSTTDTHQHPVMAYFVLWIESARCQGNIYELLYSADSMNQTEDVRRARVELLVSDMANLQKATQETNEKWIEISKKNSGEDLMDFYYISDDVLRLSLLTLIYRAAPRESGTSTTFSRSCLDAARATLARHQDCMAVVNKCGGAYLSTYVNWTLLFSPFVPFIVLFCHIIEARDQTDLDRLGTFVASIQPATDISDAAAKLHRLFQVLHSAALRYFELHASTLDDGQVEASGEINRYLTALGIPSPLGQGLQKGFVQSMGSDFAQGELDMTGANPGDGRGLINPMMRMGNGVELEHWLHSNQAMWELMEKPNFLPPHPS